MEKATTCCRTRRRHKRSIIGRYRSVALAPRTDLRRLTKLSDWPRYGHCAWEVATGIEDLQHVGKRRRRAPLQQLQRGDDSGGCWFHFWMATYQTPDQRNWRDSGRDGEGVFPVFVANPRTVRLCIFPCDLSRPSSITGFRRIRQGAVTKLTVTGHQSGSATWICSPECCCPGPAVPRGSRGRWHHEHVAQLCVGFWPDTG